MYMGQVEHCEVLFKRGAGGSFAYFQGLGRRGLRQPFTLIYLSLSLSLRFACFPLLPACLTHQRECGRLGRGKKPETRRAFGRRPKSRSESGGGGLRSGS